MEHSSSSKKPLLGTIFFYLSSNIYKRSLGLINAYIKPKLLSPEIYGLWNLLNLITTYATYYNLGSCAAMRYLIPFYAGSGEHEKVKNIKGCVFYGSLFLNMLVICGLTIFLIVRQDFSFMEQTGLLTMMALVIILWYYDYKIALLKAEHNFKLLSSVNYIKATSGAILSISLIFFLGIYGLYISAVVSYIIVIMYMNRKSIVDSYGRFKANVFKDTVKKGLPLMSYDFIIDLILSVDRIIIASMLGASYVGYYALACVLLNFVTDIPTASREVIEVRFMEHIGKGDIEEPLKEYFFKPITNIAFYMPFIIGGVVFFITPAIQLVLPKYIASAQIGQILSFGIYFICLTYVIRALLLVKNLQTFASLVIVWIIPVSIGLNIGLVKIGFGINGVALGSGVSYFILFMTLMIFAKIKYNVLHKYFNQMIKKILTIFIIMLLLIMTLQTISSIIIQNVYLQAAVSYVVYVVCMLFFIQVESKKNEFLNPIKIKSFYKF